MDLLVERVDVWAAPVEDRTGGLADVLATLRDAGAGPQSINVRRAPEAPRTGGVFVNPLRSDQEIRVASQVCLNVTRCVDAVRITGRDRPGIVTVLAQRLGEAGINLRSFSASVIGTQFVAYVALDSLDDANEAIDALAKA